MKSVREHGRKREGMSSVYYTDATDSLVFLAIAAEYSPHFVPGPLHDQYLDGIIITSMVQLSTKMLLLEL